MSHPLTRYDGTRLNRITSGRSALAVAALSKQQESYHDTDALAVIYGCPRSSDPRAPSFGKGLARHLVERYRENDLDFLTTLQGAFSLALVLDEGNDVLLSIDRLAICPLSYTVVPGGIVFASNADALNLHPSVVASIDPQSVFNYIYLHVVPGNAGIYRGEYRVPPGGYIRFRRGSLERGTYWKMSYHEDTTRDFASLKEEFGTLMRKSVCDVADGPATGTFLSGGTDSSTITGVLTEVRGEPVRTYSIGFDVPGYDELEYARIAARHFGSIHHEYLVTPRDVLDFVPKLASFCDQPFGNASAVPTFYCAHLAREDGVETLLGGDGGDELFGGNERYATQAIFSWYGSVPAAVRTGLIEPILSVLPGTDRVGLLRKAKNYVSQALMPMPDRAFSYNLLSRNPLERVFVDDFLGVVDPQWPLKMFREVYKSGDGWSMLNRMLAVDLEFTLANNDLYKVNKMCELAGVKVAYPMLGDELVRFSATLPSNLKLKGLELRHFFKKALNDFLPKEIIHKKKHGFGLPVGIWMQQHQPFQEFAYDTLETFKARKIVRSEFIDQLVDSHRTGFAAYYGAEIWSLMMLELWFRAHHSP